MIPREEELVYRTRWLVRVRWAVALLMAAGALASALVRLAYPLLPLLLVAASVAAYNALFALTTRWTIAKPVDLRRVYRFVNIQIAADFLALLAWVHYTGGPMSPFLPFFVFHLVISGLLVSSRMTLVHAAWVLAALIVMGTGEALGWLEHWSPLQHGAGRPIDNVSYLLAIGLVTAVTFVAIAAVVGGIAGRLRRRERELDDARRELEHHTRQIEAAHAKLEHLDHERSAFFRLVSHQLRAPLTSIQTVLRLVTSGHAGEPEKVAELVGRADRQAQDMLALINDMLSLTRIKSMQEVTSDDPVALDPLFADVVEASQTAAQQKAITLTAEVDSDLPSIRADRNHLKQLFAVLVQNAVKYTPRGGKVTLRAARDDDRVRVEVEDTGIGVPPEDREKVFDEFHRAANARSHERAGTGLGLTIARKIARDLGGDIELQSTLGRGSTFTVTIPVPPSTG